MEITLLLFLDYSKLNLFLCISKTLLSMLDHEPFSVFIGLLFQLIICKLLLDIRFDISLNCNTGNLTATYC